MKPIYLEKYPNIFSPLTVGHKGREITFKNRIMVSPLEAPMGNDFNGFLTDYGMNFYADFIRGGFAGYTLTYEIPRNSGHPRSLELGGGEDVIGFGHLHKLTRFTHAYNGVNLVEITHPGMCMRPGEGRVAMSADEMYWNGNYVKQMDYIDMDDAIKIHTEAAVNAMRGGFDVIQLNYAAGWLVGQFLSPLTNHRTDEFGGNVENRCRFPRMIIESIREATGDMPIELRLNAFDGYEVPEGITYEDAAQQALIFEDAGVSMIHMLNGYRTGSLGRSGNPFPPQADNLPGVIAAKKAGVKIPVGLNRKINDPELIEQLISDGSIDYVMMTRPAIADNDYVNKIRECREEDIRPCLYCNYCQDAGRRGSKNSKNITFSALTTFNGECSVNPYYGQGAWKKNIPEPKRFKKIVVVGGGVAGMVAAITASKRGHEVDLFEKSDKLGGILTFANHLWFKKELKQYREYLECQVAKSNINVHLNTKATLETIEQIDPDAVLVAVGAKPIIPNIPGVDNNNVVFAIDAIHNKDQVGKKVVLIGGGLVGCELSFALAEDGRDVTVIEMSDTLASTGQFTERVDVLEMMRRNNVKSLLNTKCTEIFPDSVKIENEEGEALLEADTVILSAGYTSLVGERDIFKNSAFDVINIGDCKEPGTIRTAVTTGFDAAMIL